MSALKIEGQGFGRTITLNDGYKMPMFGLGCFQSEPEKAVSAAEFSLKHGYQMIDTAVMYK